LRFTRPAALLLKHNNETGSNNHSFSVEKIIWWKRGKNGVKTTIACR